MENSNSTTITTPGNTTTLYILGIAITNAIKSPSGTSTLLRNTIHPKQRRPPPLLGSPWLCSRICLSNSLNEYVDLYNTKKDRSSLSDFEYDNVGRGKTTGFKGDSYNDIYNEDEEETASASRKQSRRRVRIFHGNAFDIIFFRHKLNSTSGSYYVKHNSKFVTTFPGLKLKHNRQQDSGGGKGSSKYLRILEVSGGQQDVIWMPLMRDYYLQHQQYDVAEEYNEEQATNSVNDFFQTNGCCEPLQNTTTRQESFSNPLNSDLSHRSSETLLLPFLKSGRNEVRYILFENIQHNDPLNIHAMNSTASTRVRGVANAHLHLWSPMHDKIVVVDIDGTITRSNGKVWNTIIKNDWSTCCHDGIIDFLNRLRQLYFRHQESNRTYQHHKQQKRPDQTIRFVYLTSRPLRFVGPTRNFITNYSQPTQHAHEEQSPRFDNRHVLPDGAILGFPGSTIEFISMEFIREETHIFKSHCIWNQIVKPYQLIDHATDGGDGFTNPFVAGFGNSWTDVQAYHRVGIPLNNIYKINASSAIIVWDRRSDDDDGTAADQTTVARLPENHDKGMMNDTFPKIWYKTRVGNMFESGYSDPNLLTHVLRSSPLFSQEPYLDHDKE